MDVYFVDRPLTDDQVTELGRILRGLYCLRLLSPLRQQRLPILLPVPDSDGRYSLRLRAYAPLLTEHFRRVGLAIHTPAALVLPHGNHLAGAIALALRNVLGMPPYLVTRRSDESESVRVIHASGMQNVIEREATGPLSPEEP